MFVYESKIPKSLIGINPTFSFLSALPHIENYLIFTFTNTFFLNTNKFNTNNLKNNIYLNRRLFQLLSLFIHGQDITQPRIK